MKALILIAVLFGTRAFAATETINQNSLLTAEELNGGALGTEVGAPPSRRTVNQAMYTALLTEEQISRVQLYLKSGPAQNGDLRVVQTGKPDSSQK